MVNFGALDDSIALLALAALTLLHELGVPVPMSPAAFVVGARAATGAIHPVLPVLAILAATLVGNAVWFAAGRRYGLDVLRLLGRLSVTLDNYSRRGADQFDRWGPWMLVIGRFVPGASLVAPPLAGALGMRWGRFLLLTATGAVLQGVVIVGAGMLLRHELEGALDLVGHLGGYASVPLAGALAIYLVWRWHRTTTTARIAQRAQLVEATQAATATMVAGVHAPHANRRPAALNYGLDRLTRALRQCVPVRCGAC